MRIGALISRSGPAGLWGPSTEACAILATGEINEAGGVDDKPIELVIADPGWSVAEATAAAAGLIEVEGVDAIVGMHPSNVRQAVTDCLRGRAPYYYTPQYEGGERNPATLAIGGTDCRLMSRTLPWFVEARRARRFLLVATDYVWPHRAMETAAGIIAEAGGRIIGCVTAAIQDDYDDAVEEIRRLKPDVVVMFLLGEEMVRFNRAFAAAGLSASTLRFGLGLDEHVLYGIGAEATEGLYAATTFTPSQRSHQAEHLLELYYESFGEDAPTVSVFGNSCYEGVHLAATVARFAGSCRGREMAHFVSRIKRDAVRALLPKTIFREELPVHFVGARGLDFELLATH
jgi:ABC-type branched-subunit amino acid transport system substrate-binding protein